MIHAPGAFSYTRVLPLDLSLEWDTAPTEDQLKERAEKYMTDNNIGVPEVSWKVQFVQLEQTEEYKDMALLERVLLGDTVSVVFPRMNVNASARVIKIDFDSLLERYNNVTLGSVKRNLADTIVKQQKEIEKKPSASLMQSMIVTLTATILGAKGGAVRLLDTDGDGLQDTLYVGDHADPAQAKKVWRFNYEGWAASKTGYNGPFIMGATLEDGLLAASVTAANLVAGTIKSADGKTFFLDLDNGILKMQATEFAISGKSVDQIAKEQADSVLNDYTEAVTKDIASLQSQIDGSITTWFGNSVPTGENEPASNWTTNEIKNQHLGDLFYIVENEEQGGLVYRWALVNGVYSWHLVEDVEVAKALQQASEAKDTADGKRRVFVNQPTPPYDVGDLWAQGDDGDLMRCNTARSSGSYVASDWGLASKYIDEEKAGNIAQRKVDDQTFMDIFNKWTNNGQEQGIYAENGIFVINAAVAKFINLIAEHLVSVRDYSTLEIDGATINLFNAHGKTFDLANSDDQAYMYFTQYDNSGNIVHRAQFGANRAFVGGTWVSPDVALVASQDGQTPGLPAHGGMILVDEIEQPSYSTWTPKLFGKSVEWKDNGDGTCSLIGS